jgi:hypothetical protein
VSLIKYAFEALCINEFQGLEFEQEKRLGPGKLRRRKMKKMGRLEIRE